MATNHVQKESHGSIKTYTIGFILSIVSTLIPFYLVVGKVLQGMPAVAVIFLFATIQFLIQMFFFMHLSDEDKPWWKNISLWYTVVILLVIVLGSWWIMWSLGHYAMGH